MKRTLQTLLSLAVVAASLVSCAKETLKENGIPAGEKIQVAFGASIGEFAPSDATKANAESVVRVTWAATDDKVYVYDGSACLGTLDVAPNEDNASQALLSGTITASGASPSKLALIYVKGAETAPTITEGKISVDISSQSGTDVTDVPFVLYATIDYEAEKLTKEKEFVPFKFATSVMTVNCTNLFVGEQNAKIDITKAKINGVSTACELTIDGTGITAVAGSNTGTITRTAGFEQSDSRCSFKVGLAADPADPADPAARKILVYQGDQISGSAFTSRTLAGGKSYNTVYQLSEYVIPLPEGALAGKFSVSATKKVHFSKGNLYCENGSWSFYDKQYEWITKLNLFSWGYGDWSAGSNDGYVTGHEADGEAFNADEDWGSVIGDGSLWRTLSHEEWNYLINEREGAADKCRNGITVCGQTNCFIIAPDNFTGTIEDSYDAAAWATAEESGLVCLPPTGFHNNAADSIDDDNYGYYWSASSAGPSTAHFFSFEPKAEPANAVMKAANGSKHDKNVETVSAEFNTAKSENRKASLQNTKPVPSNVNPAQQNASKVQVQVARRQPRATKEFRDKVTVKPASVKALNAVAEDINVTAESIFYDGYYKEYDMYTSEGFFAFSGFASTPTVGQTYTLADMYAAGTGFYTWEYDFTKANAATLKVDTKDGLLYVVGTMTVGDQNYTVTFTQTWGEWEDFAPFEKNTGKYTFTAAASGTQSNIPVQVRQDNTGLKQFKFAGWGKKSLSTDGIDLLVDMAPDYTCTVAEQNTGNYQSAYSEYVMVSDYATYSGEDYPSTYNPETGEFKLAMIYYISLGIFGYGYETMVMDKLITQRDTVDIVSTALKYNNLIASNKVVIYYAYDVPNYYLFRVTSNNATSVDGTFKWSDGTINDPNSYFSVSGTDKNYFQDGEFTVVTTDTGISLTGWMIGVDEKYYRLNMSKTAGVLDNDTDAPFESEFDYKDMKSSIEDGVISISVNNGEKAIGLELYTDPAATEIPAGTYVISDTKEAGTALKSVGLDKDSNPQPCWAGTIDGEDIGDCFFMVEGTVTLSYDKYGELKVVVDAKNSYGQDVKATIRPGIHRKNRLSVRLVADVEE